MAPVDYEPMYDFNPIGVSPPVRAQWCMLMARAMERLSEKARRRVNAQKDKIEREMRHRDPGADIYTIIARRDQECEKDKYFKGAVADNQLYDRWCNKYAALAQME